MSASIERIIRPAQTAGIRPSNFAVVRQPAGAVGTALITWGGPGADIFQLTASRSVKDEPIKGNETERKFDVVKVKNKDDETQFIETEVLTEYQARNQISGARIHLYYEPQKASKDVEIVSQGNVRKGRG